MVATLNQPQSGPDQTEGTNPSVTVPAAPRKSGMRRWPARGSTSMRLWRTPRGTLTSNTHRQPA